MNKLEQLADLAHQQWSGWMEYLFSKCTENNDGTITIPKWAVERWKRQVDTKYNDLPEEEKESDRNEARRVLELFKNVPDLTKKEAAAAKCFIEYNQLYRWGKKNKPSKCPECINDEGFEEAIQGKCLNLAVDAVTKLKSYISDTSDPCVSCEHNDICESSCPAHKKYVSSKLDISDTEEETLP